MLLSVCTLNLVVHQVHKYGNMETQKYGKTEIWKYRNIEIWKMEIRRANAELSHLEVRTQRV
jgi:hypothetical protein